MRPNHDDLVDDERRDGLVALVLLLGGLDELLLAVPAIRALRRCLPRHRVVLAGHPSVGDAAVQWQVADSWLPARAWHLPRMFSPDVAVNLTDGGPSSHQLLLGLRPRRLVAFENPGVRVAGPRWDLIQVGERRLREHRRTRWCRLVAVGLDIEVDTRDGLLPQLVTGQRAEEPAVLIHPGGRTGRRWAAERFAELARELRGGATAVRIVALPGEEETASTIAAAGGLDDRDVWLPATVGELTSGVARARLVIAGDTTVGHLAAACAVSGVHLHTASDSDATPDAIEATGATSARERGPLQVARRHRVLGGDLSVADVLGATADLIDVGPGLLRRAS